MRLDVLLSDDQLGGVPDPLLALVHGDQILLLGGRSERDVAAAVVVEGLRVGLPHLDARRHQFLHGRLEVVVADHAAGDARRAGRDVGLVDDEDIGAVLGGVPGGRQAVDSGADDEEGRGGGEGFGHVVRLCCSCPPIGARVRCVLGNAIGVWAPEIVIPLKEDVKVGFCGRADGSGLSDGLGGGPKSSTRVVRAWSPLDPCSQTVPIQRTSSRFPARARFCTPRDAPSARGTREKRTHASIPATVRALSTPIRDKSPTPQASRRRAGTSSVLRASFVRASGTGPANLACHPTQML